MPWLILQIQESWAKLSSFDVVLCVLSNAVENLAVQKRRRSWVGVSFQRFHHIAPTTLTQFYNETHSILQRNHIFYLASRSKINLNVRRYWTCCRASKGCGWIYRKTYEWSSCKASSRQGCQRRLRENDTPSAKAVRASSFCEALSLSHDREAYGYVFFSCQYL